MKAAKISAVVLLLLLGLLISIPAFAADDEDDDAFNDYYTIKDMFNEIATTHPEIKEAFKVLEGVSYELEAAKSGKRPTLRMDMSYGREYTKGVDTNEEARNLTASNAGVTARQNIYDGKATYSYVEETRARKMAAAYEVLNIANSVFIAAAEAYIDVLKENELLRMSMDNVTTQAQIFQQIKEKTDSGFGRRSDLINTEARLALARANVVSQQQNLKQALVRLHKHMGRYVRPEELTKPEYEYKFPKDMITLVNMSLDKYPAIKVAKYNIIAKKYSLQRTNAKFFPKIDFELNADYSNNAGGDEGDNTTASAMVYFNYDIYDGGIRSNEKKQNMSAMLKENERAYIERRNLVEAVKLALNILEAEKQKKEYLESYLKYSKETLDSYKEEYQLGRRTLVELLDMENEFQAAEKAGVESVYSAMIAKYRVLYVSGILIDMHKALIADTAGIYDEDFKIDELKNKPYISDNRDSDIAKDEYDHCDSSNFFDDNNVSGCVDESELEIGYKPPEVLDAYIKPNVSDTELVLDTGLGEPDGLGEALSLDEPEGLGQPETLAAEPVMDIKDASDVQVFNFDNIQFDLNSAKIKSKSYKLLGEIADKLKSIKGSYKLDIVGHTDTSGARRFNQKLSDQRAKAVYDWLVGLGVPAENMKAYGRGETEPLHSNRTRAGRKKNRRIEFRLQQMTGADYIAEAAGMEAGMEAGMGGAEEDSVMDIKEEMAVQVFNYNNITFDLNSARLKRSSYKIISDIADKLKALDMKYRLEIIGHTDTSGRATFNKNLSAKRAKAVYNRLVSLGVPAENMTALGKGEAEPLHSNATRAGRKKNRRIEFKFQQLNN